MPSLPNNRSGEVVLRNRSKSLSCFLLLFGFEELEEYEDDHHSDKEDEQAHDQNVCEIKEAVCDVCPVRDVERMRPGRGAGDVLVEGPDLQRVVGRVEVGQRVAHRFRGDLVVPAEGVGRIKVRQHILPVNI